MTANILCSTVFSGGWSYDNQVVAIVTVIPDPIVQLLYKQNSLLISFNKCEYANHVAAKDMLLIGLNNNMPMYVTNHKLI